MHSLRRNLAQFDQQLGFDDHCVSGGGHQRVEVLRGALVNNVAARIDKRAADQAISARSGVSSK